MSSVQNITAFFHYSIIILKHIGFYLLPLSLFKEFCFLLQIFHLMWHEFAIHFVCATRHRTHIFTLAPHGTFRLFAPLHLPIIRTTAPSDYLHQCTFRLFAPLHLPIICTTTPSDYSLIAQKRDTNAVSTNQVLLFFCLIRLLTFSHPSPNKIWFRLLFLS